MTDSPQSSSPLRRYALAAGSVVKLGLGANHASAAIIYTDFGDVVVSNGSINLDLDGGGTDLTFQHSAGPGTPPISDTQTNASATVANGAAKTAIPSDVSLEAEPSAMGLLALGAAGTMLRRRRKA